MLVDGVEWSYFLPQYPAAPDTATHHPPKIHSRFSSQRCNTLPAGFSRRSSLPNHHTTKIIFADMRFDKTCNLIRRKVESTRVRSTWDTDIEFCISICSTEEELDQVLYVKPFARSTPSIATFVLAFTNYELSIAGCCSTVRRGCQIGLGRSESPCWRL